MSTPRTRTPRPGQVERVLLHLRDVDEAIAPLQHRPVVRGYSLRAIARTEADGRRSVAITVHVKMVARRASGKAYTYWTRKHVTSLAWTKQQLLVARTLSKAGMLSWHVFGPSGVADWTRSALETGSLYDRRGQRAESLDLAWTDHRNDLVSRVSTFMGMAPTFTDRFPLLPEMIPGEYMPWLDATDLSQVAKHLFGQRAYRKPLVMQVGRLDPAQLHWFSLFRGLVPTEWLIEAMSRTTPAGRFGWTATASEERNVRRILVRTPQTILRRILAEDAGIARMALLDAARGVSTAATVLQDLDDLPAAIAARGQRNIRGSRDLELLILALPKDYRSRQPRRDATITVLAREAALVYGLNEYNRHLRNLEHPRPEATWEDWMNERFRIDAEDLLAEHRRRRMEAEELERAERAEQRRNAQLASQKERHEWAARTADALDGQTIAGFDLIVARDAKALAVWCNTMGNCIGGYARELDLDVFFALTDGNGKTRVNAQVRYEQGIVQLLGRRNVDLRGEVGEDVAIQIIAALHALGAPIAPDAWGVAGLEQNLTAVP